jgi:hypothetical protein
MYEQQQAEASPQGAAGAGSGASADAGPAGDEVVDAEFSEVDDEQKS